MRGGSEEVQSVLRSVRVSLNRSAEDFTGQHIAMALYGLQEIKIGLGQGDAEGLQLLEVLNEQIQRSEHNMSMSHIASAVYGLKVLLFLGIISPSLKSVSFPLEYVQRLQHCSQDSRTAGPATASAPVPCERDRAGVGDDPAGSAAHGQRAQGGAGHAAGAVHLDGSQRG